MRELSHSLAESKEGVLGYGSSVDVENEKRPNWISVGHYVASGFEPTGCTHGANSRSLSDGETYYPHAARFRLSALTALSSLSAYP